MKKPFDYVISNLRERPLSSDLNNAQSQIARSTMLALDSLLSPNLYYGGTPVTVTSSTYRIASFIGDGFMPTPGTGMQVKLLPGLGLWCDNIPAESISSISGLDDLGRYTPLVLPEEFALTVAAAHAVNPRIDSIQVKLDRALTDTQTRDVFSGVSFAGAAVSKTLSYENTPIIVTGTPAGSPAAPAITTGYAEVARVYVPALAASITEANIVDMRRPVGLFGLQRVTLICSKSGSAPYINVSSVIGPPGYKVCINTLNYPSYIDVYLFGGAFQADPSTAVPAKMYAFATQDNGSTDINFVNLYTSMTNGSVDGTLQGFLTAGAQTSPEIDVGIGTRYGKVQLVLRNYDGTNVVAGHDNTSGQFSINLVWRLV